MNVKWNWIVIIDLESSSHLGQSTARIIYNPLGNGVEYLFVPYLNLHSHYRLLILVVSVVRETKERQIL